MTETFYPKLEFFASATGANKPKLKNVCPDCGKGTLFSVEQPRIRWGLNQQSYRCSACQSLHVVQFSEGR